eukprot:TRINITY_DN122027_c0_g1_i1.p1 TRINITY_DN122027_c0_g1~~TRINITY_DN122027_c0_g1_i1.p1  ORF type:complete len:275 (+),score=43.17 TRINITY_DN122027_c0_g1_i1:97-921(+)
MAPALDLVVAAMRHAPLVVLLLLLHIYVVGASSSDVDSDEGEPTNADDVCSKALGFNDSLVPKDRSAQDLHFCTEHHKRTCCEKNHTQKVLGQFSSFAHDRSARCVQMTKLALCSVCDADVGIGLKADFGNPILCPSFCTQWYQACIEDLYAPSGSGDLSACGPNSLVCSPLGEITEEPRRFCEKAGGFAVAAAETDGCYDGVPTARIRGKGPRAHWERPKPNLPPWWKKHQIAFEHWMRQFRMPRRLEDYLPGVVVAVVAVVFGWFLFTSAGD